jgi:hypothetical protein
MAAKTKKSATKLHRPNSGIVKQLHVNLDAKDRKLLEALSGKLKLTASGVVRHLLHKAVGSQKPKSAKKAPKKAAE